MPGGAAESQRRRRERAARAKKQTGVVANPQHVSASGIKCRIAQNGTTGTVLCEEIAGFSAEMETLNRIALAETHVPSVQRNSLRIGCGPVGF